MINIEDMLCCGMRELDYIQGEETIQIILTICSDIICDENKYRHVVFSDNGNKISGKKLEKEIKKQKLGSIISTVSKINPNSGNSIKAWIWTIDHKALNKYWSKHKTEYEYRHNDEY